MHHRTHGLLCRQPKTSEDLADAKITPSGCRLERRGLESDNHIPHLHTNISQHLVEAHQIRRSERTAQFELETLSGEL